MFVVHDLATGATGAELRDTDLLNRNYGDPLLQPRQPAGRPGRPPLATGPGRRNVQHCDRAARAVRQLRRRAAGTSPAATPTGSCGLAAAGRLLAVVRWPSPPRIGPGAVAEALIDLGDLGRDEPGPAGPPSVVAAPVAAPSRSRARTAFARGGRGGRRAAASARRRCRCRRGSTVRSASPAPVPTSSSSPVTSWWCTPATTGCCAPTAFDGTLRWATAMPVQRAGPSSAVGGVLLVAAPMWPDQVGGARPGHRSGPLDRRRQPQRGRRRRLRARPGSGGAGPRTSGCGT